MRLGQSGRSAELPTTTIYFSEAMADQIGPFGSSAHAVWRVSANAFLIPGRNQPQILIFRRVDPEAHTLLRQMPAVRIHYLIDDDIWAGITDPNLPLAYRQRLFRLVCGISPVLRRAECVYVTSHTLQERFRHRAKLIHPGLVEVPASLEHHDDRCLRILFAGTRSHVRDLEAVADPLVRFLEQHRDCELHTFLGSHAPQQLRLPNAVHHPPQVWEAYRETLRNRRYHIGIVPALPTRFNAARSHNKILELAAFGAAPVYGSGRLFRHMAAAAGAGLTCDRIEDWFGCPTRLNQDRLALRQVAAANRSLALQLGDTDSLRSFWQQELGLRLTPTIRREAA